MIRNQIFQAIGQAPVRLMVLLDRGVNGLELVSARSDSIQVLACRKTADMGLQ
jgi:hypothetical protein